MAVCTTANARAAMLGPVLVATMASSTCWFQARTTLSPLPARAGWGLPTVATRPKVRTSATPMTVVTLRICRHPSAGQPTRARHCPQASRRELEPWRGQGQGTHVLAGQDLPFSLQDTTDRFGDRPGQGHIAGAQLPTTRPGE